VMATEEADDAVVATTRYGAFLTTFVAFSLAELGDKTQFTTAALAMKFAWIAVVMGSTLGMALAILPVVIFGDRVCQLVPMRYMRWTSGVLFAGVGVATLAGWL